MVVYFIEEFDVLLFEIIVNFLGEIDGNNKRRWKGIESLWSWWELVRRFYIFEEICFFLKVD